MNVLLLLTTLLLSLNWTVAVPEEHEEWYAFKITHNKQYETKTEESVRFKIFKRNLKKIQEHNKQYDEGLVSYKKGVNQFADLTKEEFIAKYHKYSVVKTSVRRTGKLLKMDESLPSEIDWRKRDAVTPVKNQGACGSAVAFSVIGAIEGALAIKTGHLKTLDEKNLINCTGIIESGGCDRKATGAFAEKNIGTCLYYDSEHDEMDTYNFVDVPSGSEDNLQEAVALYCPVFVAIDATDLQFYTTGTFYDPGCSSTQVNHAVLVVGYGTDSDGKAFWLIKNSWGTQWGEEGYAKLARNAGNNCGVATYGAYPVL